MGDAAGIEGAEGSGIKIFVIVRSATLPTDLVLPKPLLITEGKIHFMRAVSGDQTIPVFNVNWSAGLAQPDQGVWATLFITTRGARLCTYDQAPDVLKRRCFANHPFRYLSLSCPCRRDFKSLLPTGYNTSSIAPQNSTMSVRSTDTVSIVFHLYRTPLDTSMNRRKIPPNVFI